MNDTVSEICNLRRHCMSVKDIAKNVHKSDRYVVKVLRDCGCYDSGVGQIVSLRKGGLSIKAIGKKLRLGEHLVASVVKSRCGNKAYGLLRKPASIGAGCS